MKFIKNHVLIACASFSIITFLYCILGELSIAPEIDNKTVYQLLILNFTVSFVMFFTNKLHFETVYSLIAVSIADIFAVVFLIGGLIMKMFPFRLYIVASVSAMIVLAYFFVFGIMFIKGKAEEDCINKKIKERNDRDEK